MEVEELEGKQIEIKEIINRDLGFGENQEILLEVDGRDYILKGKADYDGFTTFNLKEVDNNE